MKCPECGFNAREIGLIEDEGKTFRCCRIGCGEEWHVDEQQIIADENSNFIEIESAMHVVETARDAGCCMGKYSRPSPLFITNPPTPYNRKEWAKRL
jgi:hypothetical protein